MKPHPELRRPPKLCEANFVLPCLSGHCTETPWKQSQVLMGFEQPEPVHRGKAKHIRQHLGPLAQQSQLTPPFLPLFLVRMCQW